ncbi:MAG: prephenate dehydrogenase [bacterium]|nr:prephenate dehydrogenase [bacterium]
MKKKLFNKVCIFGVGLIGGSIGMAIKKNGLADKVIGIGRNIKKLKKAVLAGAVDTVTTDYIKEVKDADLVILSMHIKSSIEAAKRIAPFLKKDAVVTDVESTKELFYKKMQEILPDGIHFVGAHPIAGLERHGVDVATHRLFNGAVCVITKTSKTNKDALLKVKKLWNKMGADVVLFSPSQHDKLVALTSHLPHIAAVSLVSALGKTDTIDKDLKLVIGKGFRDTTRIASSSPQMWQEICITNKKNILDALSRFQRELGKIYKLIHKSDREELIKKLEEAKSLRTSLK